VANLVAYPEDGCNGIEQPSRTGRDRGSDALSDHLHQAAALRRSEGVQCGNANLGFDSRPQDLREDGKGAATGLLDGDITARQPKWSQGGRATPRVIIYDEELAPPDRAVRAKACTVPRHSQDRRLEFMLSHRGENVRQMVLDRHGSGGKTACELRRDVVRMEVAGHGPGLYAVQCREVVGRPLKGGPCFHGLQVAEVLPDDDPVSFCDGDRALQMGPQGER
jgi:hypothetical protein